MGNRHPRFERRMRYKLSLQVHLQQALAQTKSMNVLSEGQW